MSNLLDAHVPAPKWVCLRTAEGKLLARFDAQRCLLEIAQRGQYYYFDLFKLILDAELPIPALDSTRPELSIGIDNS